MRHDDVPELTPTTLSQQLQLLRALSANQAFHSWEQVGDHLFISILECFSQLRFEQDNETFFA